MEKEQVKALIETIIFLTNALSNLAANVSYPAAFAANETVEIIENKLKTNFSEYFKETGD